MASTGEVSLEARSVAEALIGAPAALHPIRAAGRNSRIYCVRSGERIFALKQYPLRQDDRRERLSTEVGALRLMERCKVDDVPRVVGVDDEHGYALLTWIEGAAVGDLHDADIDRAVAFLAAIHELRREPDAFSQPPAAEACWSGVEIERQINTRIDVLRAAAGDRNLIEFIDGIFVPEQRGRMAVARAAARAAGIDFATDLPQKWQTLVPADFGFHNSLRRPDGSLAFVDFEYFGWDDPVKLTADILLHPGRPLTPPQRQRFRQAAIRLYGDDRLFGQRLVAYLPLFALRWVLILLNEFVPERWRRRVLAGETGSWEAAKARQLTAARAFLAALPQMVET